MANKPHIPLMAGFECSTFRRSDGMRIDMIVDTHHEELADADFRLMRSVGILTMREGLRWHVIEPQRGRRDWSGVKRIIEAANANDVELIWDVLHFGLPDWVNPYHPEFPALVAELATDFAQIAGPRCIYVPVNEISFMAWAGGDVEFMYPYSRGRGGDLKLALCRAAIAATHAIRQVWPKAVIMAVEPMIRVHASYSEDRAKAVDYDRLQFEAVDMLTGAMHPDLGGHPSLVDIVGVNHYPYSQWFLDRGPLDWREPPWASLSSLLAGVYRRYGKPLLLAETGCEGDDRAPWFRHVVSECEAATARGIPLLGICLYPILSHIAWTGERHCPNGLFDGATPAREVEQPLLDEILHYNKMIVGSI